MDWGRPGSSVHGILQARILEWVAMLSSRGSFQTRDQTQVCRITGRSFTIWATREAHYEHLVYIIYTYKYRLYWDSLVAQTVKHLPIMQETQVRSLGREDPLEKVMAMHSSILAWKIPWTEEPGKLQSRGSQRVGYDWGISLSYRLYSLYNINCEFQILHFTCMQTM